MTRGRGGALTRWSSGRTGADSRVGRGSPLRAPTPPPARCAPESRPECSAVKVGRRTAADNRWQSADKVRRSSVFNHCSVLLKVEKLTHGPTHSRYQCIGTSTPQTVTVMRVADWRYLERSTDTFGYVAENF